MNKEKGYNVYKRDSKSTKSVGVRMPEDLHEWCKRESRKHHQGIAGFIKDILYRIKDGMLR